MTISEIAVYGTFSSSFQTYKLFLSPFSLLFSSLCALTRAFGQMSDNARFGRAEEVQSVSQFRRYHTIMICNAPRWIQLCIFWC